MREIPLTQGQIALVDDEDYTDLAQFNWYAVWDEDTKGYYAVRAIPHLEKPGEQTAEKMHRRILGLKFGDPRCGDHINHETTDNQKRNLRIVSSRQNGANRRDQSKHGLNIYYNKKNTKRPYWVQFNIDRKSVYVGCYMTHSEAIKARDNFKRKHNLT